MENGRLDQGFGLTGISPSGRRTGGFPYDQFRFQGVLVAKFETRAVNTLQKDFGSDPPHFPQRLAHRGWQLGFWKAALWMSSKRWPLFCFYC